MLTTNDWNEKTVDCMESKGGVTALQNPLENLIRTKIFPFPTPEIIQKLYKSERGNAFSETQKSSFTNYYTDLQSLNSEDAITWSVFGVLNYHAEASRNKFVSDLLALAGINDAVCTRTCVWLWRRIPHPETLVSGGPELDFGIITDNTVVFGESKWNSSVSNNQGVSKRRNQMELRVDFLRKYGVDFFPYAKNKVVLLVSKGTDNSFDCLSDGVVDVKNIHWEDVCKIESHPLSDEVKRYYYWKIRK